MSLLAGDQARVQLEGAMHAMEDRLHNSRQSSAFLLPSSHSAALHTADQGAPRRTIQHSATHARRAVVPIHLGRPARPSPPIPKRSPQALITPRRESPQQIKAAPRRAGPYEVGVAGSRGIGRGVPEDSFAPTRPPSSPPVRCTTACLRSDTYVYLACNHYAILARGRARRPRRVSL